MKDTSLGLGGRDLAGTMQCQVDEHNDWDWNSAYWRNLGSPWGGAHSTAADVGRFLRYFADPTPPVLKPATVAAMITDQNRGLNTPWGIGWMLRQRPRQTLVAEDVRAQRFHRDARLDGSREGR